MPQKLRAFCFAFSLVALRPALAADYTDLQASTSGTSGQTVTVAVHNPMTVPLSARVRVPVQLDDDIFFLATSSNFTVAAGATISVAITAPAPVGEILEDPQPIEPVQ
jgi:hypothetical protein